MPDCNKCGKHFPRKIYEDSGKIRFLGNRKRCFDCSPFPREVPDTGEPVVCAVCGREYLYNKKNRKSHTRTKCNSCMVNKYKEEKKLKALEYKGGRCCVCGYNRCVGALVFHHIDDTTKDFIISGNHSRSWDKIQSELDKCALLCSNCHMEVHAGLVDLSSPSEVC